MPDLLTSTFPKGDHNTLQGVLDHFIFQNEENGYSVARFIPQDQSDGIVAVGPLLGAAPGETLRLEGTWETHQKFGRQFKVSMFTPIPPSTLEGIESFLGSGLIKGIGPKYAKSIVQHFGLATLDVMEKEPERLREVRDIGPARAEKAAQAWRQQRNVRDMMIFLLGHNITARFASRIIRTYGDQAARIIEKNPYRLADDMIGVGFIKADQIARSQGLEADAPARIRAGLLHALSQMSKNGHTCPPRAPLLEEAQRILDIPVEQVETVLDDMAGEPAPRPVVPIRFDGQAEMAYYPHDLLQHERFVAEKIRRLQETPKKLPAIDAAAHIDVFEKQYRFALAEQQKAAIALAVQGGVTVLTGGPGTGKTTIVRTLLHILDDHQITYRLASPTGRAAKRLAETTRRRATTLHRLLKWSPQEGRFFYNRDNPMRVDFLIIDEVSMLDIALAARILDALPDTTSVVLVGDVDQLPSVGPGAVLEDLIASGQVPVARLNEVFRQAQRSLIIRNAHRINQGEYPYIPRPEDKPTPDFFFTPKDDQEEILRVIKALVQDRIPFKFGLRPKEDIQIITFMHRGVLGTENLNREMQHMLNPTGKPLTRGASAFRVGDKVMQTRNNYDKDVYNGDIGIVLSIQMEDQEMRVRFDDRTVEYEYDDLDQLTLSYAISAHKSQGSEYRAVVIPIHTEHFIMLQRNVLYTAVTRAKNLVCLVGTKKALALAVRNDRMSNRWTGLNHLLQPGAPEAQP